MGLRRIDQALTHLALILGLVASAVAQNPETAVFPGDVAADDALLVWQNLAETSLSDSVDASTETLPVASTASYVRFPTTVRIGTEQIKVCGKTGAEQLDVCSGGRGFDGSTAASHLGGEAVINYVPSYWFHRVTAEIAAIEGALGAGLVNVLAATTEPAAGDVSGSFDAGLTVADDSHAHTGATVSGLAAADVESGTFADARVAESNVTQHEAALDIAPSQITGLHGGTDLTADLEEDTHAAEHAEGAADELAVEALGTACPDGQAFKSDGAGGVDCAAAAEGDYDIGQMGDVAVSSAAEDDVLMHNGTQWVNQALLAAHISNITAATVGVLVSGCPDGAAVLGDGTGVKCATSGPTRITGLTNDTALAEPAGANAVAWQWDRSTGNFVWRIAGETQRAAAEDGGGAKTDGNLAVWNAAGKLVDGGPVPSGGGPVSQTLYAESAYIPASNGGYVDRPSNWPEINLSEVSGTGDRVFFHFRAGPGFADGDVAVTVDYKMETATSGNVELAVSYKCLGAADYDAAAYSTASASGDKAVPGTAGAGGLASWTLSSATIAEGDVCSLELQRIEPSATEATGEIEILALTLSQ